MKKYFSFDRAASRSEYWGAQIIGLGAFLSLLLFSVPLMALSILLGIALIISIVVGYIWLVLSVTIRRCKDAGINPFWTAACFLPYVGLIVWIVIGVLPSSTEYVG